MNVKDRKNRHNILRILNIIETNADAIIKENEKGLFIFCGINDCGQEIFYTIKPNLINKTFYYNCGSKFVVDFIFQYFDDYDGNIIFTNGEMCIIYKYANDNFQIWNSFKSMIYEKHKKGGQSSVRFGRIADNIREKYIITIIENINNTRHKKMNIIC